MSGALTRRTGTVDRLQPGALATSAVTFTTLTSGTWADLPEASRRHDDGVGVEVASDINTDVDTPRLVRNKPRQVRHAWRAYLDRVLVFTNTRPVSVDAEGAMTPTGPWEHDRVDVYTGIAPPRRTNGVVAPGPVLDSAPQHAGADSEPPLDQAQAARSFAFLPANVRSGIERLTPNPDVWLGVLTMRESGRTTEQTMNMLRIAGDVGVALRATRTHHDSQPKPTLDELAWTITQVTYKFGGAARQIGYERLALEAAPADRGGWKRKLGLR